MSADVIEFLRSNERRTWHAWMQTPGHDPLVHARAAEWRKALERLNDELDHRAAIMGRR